MCAGKKYERCHEINEIERDLVFYGNCCVEPNLFSPSFDQLFGRRDILFLSHGTI